MTKLIFRKKVVVGGEYRDFLAWCREQGISPMQARWAGNDVEKIIGLELKPGDIVRLRNVSPRMEEALRTRIR